VDLPLIEAEPAAPAADAPEAEAPRRRLVGLRGLVCDDNDTNRQIVRDLLETQGAHCVVCADGQQALDWLREHPGAIDVVFMDVQMPVLDGLHAARRLRSDPATAGLTVIALSAGSLASEREAALAAGMNAFVGKPFDMHQLVQAVREHLPPALRARLGEDGGAPSVGAPAWPRLADLDESAMRELLDLLLRRDLDAIDWVMAHGAALAQRLGPARAQALRAAVESLDYASAVRCLGEPGA
jgi:CheY-like chemotaxis protein